MAADPLLELLTSKDPAQAAQGLELARILADPAWFDAALAPIAWRGNEVDPFSPGGIRDDQYLPRRVIEGLLRIAPPGSSEAARVRGEIRRLAIDLDDPHCWPLAEAAELPNLERLLLEGSGVVRGAAALERMKLRRLEIEGLDGLDAPRLRLRGLVELILVRTLVPSLQGLGVPRLQRLELDHHGTSFAFRGERLEDVCILGEVDPAQIRGLEELYDLCFLHLSLSGPLPELPYHIEHLFAAVVQPTLTIADLPRLRLLTITRGAQVERVRLGAGLPALAQLDVRCSVQEPVAGLTALPALRELTLRVPQPDLAALPNVERLVLLGETPPDALFPPRLRRLWLTLQPDEPAPAVPETLEDLSIEGPELPRLPPLPALRSLTVRARQIDPAFDWSALDRFPALAELALHDQKAELPEELTQRLAIRRDARPTQYYQW